MKKNHFGSTETVFLIRIRSGFNQVRGSGSGRAKMPTKKGKVKKFVLDVLF
jgi:hypothetical protein